jgi:glycine/serine hydroxymethyltransferase
MREAEMEQIGAWIGEILLHIGDAATEQRVRGQVAELAGRFPIYESRVKPASDRVEHARV